MTRLYETLAERVGIALGEQPIAPIPDWFLVGRWCDVPSGWMRRALPLMPYRYTSLYEDVNDRLMAIVTGGIEADGKRWVHVSASRPSRLPDWYDMCKVKDAFLGEEALALQVMPPRSQHVNLHPHCLHLWHCVDGDVTPDFRHEGTI